MMISFPFNMNNRSLFVVIVFCSPLQPYQKNEPKKQVKNQYKMCRPDHCLISNLLVELKRSNLSKYPAAT